MPSVVPAWKPTPIQQAFKDLPVQSYAQTGLTGLPPVYSRPVLFPTASQGTGNAAANRVNRPLTGPNTVKASSVVAPATTGNATSREETPVDVAMNPGSVASMRQNQLATMIPPGKKAQGPATYGAQALQLRMASARQMAREPGPAPKAYKVNE